MRFLMVFIFCSQWPCHGKHRLATTYRAQHKKFTISENAWGSIFSSLPLLNHDRIAKLLSHARMQTIRPVLHFCNEEGIRHVYLYLPLQNLWWNCCRRVNKLFVSQSLGLLAYIGTEKHVGLLWTPTVCTNLRLGCRKGIKVLGFWNLENLNEKQAGLQPDSQI